MTGWELLTERQAVSRTHMPVPAPGVVKQQEVPWRSQEDTRVMWPDRDPPNGEVQQTSIFMSHSTSCSVITAENTEIIYSTMFIVFIFIIAKSWKQPWCPSTEEWIQKMWYIYTMEYYSAIKNNEFMKFLGKWMDLEDIILSKVTQSQKNTHDMYSLISGYYSRSSEYPRYNLQNTWNSRRKTKVWILLRRGNKISMEGVTETKPGPDRDSFAS
jgi:hypothetical protein